MKPIFWNKVPPFNAKGTIWEKPLPDGERIQPNFSELEDFFCVRDTKTISAGQDSNASGQQQDDAAKKKDEVITLLDMKRANNLNIVLSQFRGFSFEQIRDAVATADASKLPADKLAILVHSLPTDEEVTAITEFEGDMSKLGNAERFYRVMLELPRFSAKVEGFFLRSDFDTRIAELSGQIRSLSEAATEIVNGHNFRRLLDTILQVGNFLNSGTSRGNALGFKLDALPKLKAVKATNEGKVSLVQYLARFMDQQAADLAKIDQQYPSLAEALRLSIDQLSGDLEKLMVKLSAIEREVTLGQNEEASRVWCDQMATFLGRARVEVQRNKDSLTTAVSDLTRVMQHYAMATTPSAGGGESGRTPQEEFLALFHEFLEDWKKARADNQRAERMMAKIKEREDKKKREELAKDEKRQRLIAAGGKGKSKDVISQVDDVMLELSQSGKLRLSTSGK